MSKYDYWTQQTDTGVLWGVTKDGVTEETFIATNSTFAALGAKAMIEEYLALEQSMSDRTGVYVEIDETAPGGVYRVQGCRDGEVVFECEVVGYYDAKDQAQRFLRFMKREPFHEVLR